MEINWTTSGGQRITLTLAAEFELDAQGREKNVGRKVVVVTATIDGVRESAFVVEPTNHPVAVAKFGTIGLTQDNYDRYLAALADVEQSIAAHNAECDTHADSLDALSAQATHIYNA